MAAPGLPTSSPSSVAGKCRLAWMQAPPAWAFNQPPQQRRGAGGGGGGGDGAPADRNRTKVRAVMTASAAAAASFPAPPDGPSRHQVRRREGHAGRIGWGGAHQERQPACWLGGTRTRRGDCTDTDLSRWAWWPCESVHCSGDCAQLHMSTPQRLHQREPTVTSDHDHRRTRPTSPANLSSTHVMPFGVT